MAYASALSSFKFNQLEIAAVGNVAFSMQRAPLDVTAIGSYNSYFIDGVAASAFTLDVYYAYGDHTALIADIMDPLGAGRPLSFVIYLKESATADYIAGYCIITGFDVVSQSGDVVRASFSAQVIGQLEINNTFAQTGATEVEEAPPQ